MPLSSRTLARRGGLRQSGAMKALVLILFTCPAFAGEPAQLITAARDQVGVTVIYDPAYVSLTFPGGDIDPSRGVCTDVVIRALRATWGIDLQAAINRDMKRAFSAYPNIWGMKTPDRNIDHRRVANLQRLFARAGADLAVTSEPADYRPGDVVSWMLPGNLPHIGILSDRLAADGHPLVLHNIGRGAQEEDMLFAAPITGHCRLTQAAQDWLLAVAKP